MHKFSTRSINNMRGVKPALVAIANKALEISNVDFGIPETGGLRSSQAQYKLFEMGVSKLDGIDKISKHQLGYALDFYVYSEFGNYYKPAMTTVACAFFQSAMILGGKLKWGGFWKNPDYPHIELYV